MPAFCRPLTPASPTRHCEERSDEEQSISSTLHWIASPCSQRRNNKGSGTPTDAWSLYAVLLARPRILRDAHIYRRSTAVLPWGVFHPQVQLQAMLPGTWQSADPLIPRQGEDPHAVIAGVTRPNLSHVQRAPRVPVRSAGRLMPEAARERFASPPAGTALAPLLRCASGAGPLRERDTHCNSNSD